MALLVLRPGVTSLTRRAYSVRFMATDAARHAGDTGVLRHRVHLRHLTVAHHALHTGRQMLAVRPGHAGSDLVDTLPRNRRTGSREFGQLNNGRFVFGDRTVALQADSGGRKRHLIPRIGIRVAPPAFQTQRYMCLVTIWQRLRRRGVGRDIIGNFLFCGGRLLCRGNERHRY